MSSSNVLMIQNHGKDGGQTLSRGSLCKHACMPLLGNYKIHNVSPDVVQIFAIDLVKLQLNN